ncbi:MAG: N,N-dimethylformamidase beta subunit family domain-containing protein [Myxococcales bacterium]
MIAAENNLPGSSGWQLANPSGHVFAYTDRTSAFPDEQVGVHAAANNATSATWELWRFGYYGGKGGRQIASGGPVQLRAWSAPVLDAQLGSVNANYPVAFSFQVPHDAVTGVYFVKVKSSLGDTYATFVVKEPAAGAAILFPVATNTYQAYNDWGGTSLYANHRSDWSPWHAYAVSFERPYQNNGSGEVLSMDRGLIAFIEAQGYDVTYVSDRDVDADPGLTADRRMILYPAHTEYWTANMRDAARKAIASGANVAFMGANSAYWQVRYSDDTRRLLIGYKEFASLDPARSSDPAHVTTRWRDPPLNSPENAMEGGMFGSWTWGAAPYTVTDPTLWLWAGAGVQAGSIICGVYGDETDRRYDNGLTPAGISVVANSFVENHDAHYAYAESTLYPSAAGGMVFDAGSITFSWALGKAGRWDPRIQQLGANLFSRFAGDGTVPANLLPMKLSSGLPTPTWRPGVQVTTITNALQMPTAVAAAADGSAIVADGDRIVRVSSAGAVTVIAGSTAGLADGPAAQAQFRGPRGVAVAANGTIYVSDTGNHRIRAIANGVVTTLAGSDEGFADGSAPKFLQPMAIALTATGTILVADTWNMRVREVTPQGVASTWAGSGAEGIVDGSGTQAQLNFPMGITVLPGGDAVIVEPAAGVLRKVSAVAPHNVSTIVGYPGDSGWQDGPASSANVLDTVAVGTAKDGEIILVDQATSRIRALKGGTIDTLAGGNRGGTVDGPGAQAGFAAPRAVAGAPDGSVLVVDAREHTLRRITLP